MLNKGWRIPFSSHAIINEEEYLDIIDQMRISIPAEIKQAERIQQDRDRIIAQGQEEADRIVSLAKEEAERIVNEHQLIEKARRRGDSIIEEAQRVADEIRSGADDYAIEVLTRLQRQLTSFQKTVQNGLTVLNRPVSSQETDEQQWQTEASTPVGDQNI
ncbi:MAG: ATPase [Anaerolineae bacterium]